MIGSICGTLLFITGIALLSESDGVELAYVHAVLFPFILLTGLGVTSVAFKELNDNEEGSAWLTLPASLIEKYAHRLLQTSIGFFVKVTIIYTLFFGLLEGAIGWVGDPIPVRFNPIDTILLDYLGLYLVTHSIVLVGALYYRRLMYTITVLVILVFFLLGAEIVIFRGFTATQLEIVKAVSRIPFWGMLAPVCWIAGYRFLKRAEI